MKFPLQQHLLLSSSCRRVAMWTSRTEAIVYVARRRLQLIRVIVVQESGV